MDMTNKITCIHCGSKDVEIQLPAWFNPNKKLKFVDVDECAEELAVWCNKCGDNTALVAPNGKVITGRW
jgi:rRNA maturation protein Nop10